MVIQNSNDVVYAVDKKELSEGEQNNSFLRRLYQQAKQLSQIIAYIWRWADKDRQPQQEVAKQLKTYLDRPTEKIPEVGGNLKET